MREKYVSVVYFSRKQQKKTLLKNDSVAFIFIWPVRNFLEQLLCKTALDQSFWIRPAFEKKALSWTALFIGLISQNFRETFVFGGYLRNVTFLFLLKTSRFSDVFRGSRNATLGRNGSTKVATAYLKMGSSTDVSLKFWKVFREMRELFRAPRISSFFWDSCL